MKLKKGHAYLEVISGPMFSGKTREMQRQYKIFKICDYKIQVFRRDIDTRYGEGITTHDGIEFEKNDVFYAKNSDDIEKQLINDVDVIMIDEAMFYDKELVEKVEQWVKNGKVVVANLLPTDYTGNVFGIAGELLARSDFITALTARCMHQENGEFCHEPATKTFRKVPIKDQVVIGGFESYEPRCRKHHSVLDGEPKVAIKTIIFDLDGTLLDSKESHYRAFREVGQRFNIKVDFTMDKYLEWYSPNYWDLYRKMGIEEKDWSLAIQIWREYYLSNENPELFPNVIEILYYLKSKGFKLALVTGGSEKRINFDLTRKQIRNFFDVVVHGEGLKEEELKPAPKQLLIALEKLGVSAIDAVYIGDTPMDVMAGKNAGMKTIAVTMGFGLSKKIKESNPDIIISNLEELKRIF